MDPDGLSILIATASTFGALAAAYRAGAVSASEPERQQSGILGFSDRMAGLCAAFVFACGFFVYGFLRIFAQAPWWTLLCLAALAALAVLLYSLGRAKGRIKEKSGFTAACMLGAPLAAPAKLVFKALGLSAQSDVTEEDVLSFVDDVEEHDLIDESQKKMITNIFELDDVTAGDVMTHRTEIVSVEENTPAADAVRLSLEHGFSRLPVYRKSLDDIVGILYVKDLFALWDTPEKAQEFLSADVPLSSPMDLLDMDKAFYPTEIPVPYTEIVHDRIMLEVFRGCSRGCRFCHAGMVYRPVRERKPEVLMDLSRKLVDNTGYNEISLVSLSSADYSCLAPLVHKMIGEFKDERVSVSLPSLRIDSFCVAIAKEVQAVRKSGLTFAPEAGSQKMRDVINKGVTEEDLMNAVGAAFESGWNSVKLYFMIGLPYETDEDVLAIADLARKVQYKYFQITGKRGCKVTVSASSFVPKPYTAFQWFAQNDLEEIRRKQFLLKDEIKKYKNITLNYHDAKTGTIEAVFARGDRRVGKALLLAWQKGARFDGWSDCFSYERWLEAISDAGLDKDFYAARERGENEAFPWEHISPGVSRRFLWNEWRKAYAQQLTHDCRRTSCTGCGVCQALGVKIVDYKEAYQNNGEVQA